MKKFILLSMLSLVILICFPKIVNAANISITSVTSNGNVLISVTADVQEGYKLQLTYSEFIDGEYANPTYLEQFPHETNEYIFTIRRDQIDSGVYCFQAEIRDTRGSSAPYALSNEVYKEIIKDSSGIIIKDYYPPDPNDTSRPTEYINVSAKDVKDISKLMGVFFKYAKNYNINGMKSCLKKVTKKSFITNKDMQKFIRKANKKHLRYKIRKVVVSGKKAKITMDVGYYDAGDDFTYALKKEIKNYNKTKKLDFNAVIKSMKKAYKYANEQSKKSITVTLVKSKGKWKIKTLSSDLQRITDCTIIETIDKFDENPLLLLF